MDVTLIQPPILTKVDEFSCCLDQQVIDTYKMCYQLPPAVSSSLIALYMPSRTRDD